MFLRPNYGRRLLRLMPIIHCYEPLLKLLPFEDQFFFITRVHPKARAAICDIDNGLEGRRVYRFPQY